MFASKSKCRSYDEGEIFAVNWENFAEAKKQVEMYEKLQKEAFDRLKNPSDTPNSNHFRRNTQPKEIERF